MKTGPHCSGTHGTASAGVAPVAKPAGEARPPGFEEFAGTAKSKPAELVEARPPAESDLAESAEPRPLQSTALGIAKCSVTQNVDVPREASRLEIEGAFMDFRNGFITDADFAICAHEHGCGAHGR